MRLVPLLIEPVVPSTNTSSPYFFVLRIGKDPTTETSNLRREIHLRPDSGKVHVVQARVDVITAGAHLLETEGLELHSFRTSTGDRIHADLGEDLTLELPDLVAFRRLDQLRAVVPHIRGQIGLEEMRRLDDVIVHGDDRVLLLPWFRIGQKELWIEFGSGHSSSP